MRFIDADKFKDFIDMTCDMGGAMYPVVREIKEYVKKQIDGQPTADVRKNLCGEWGVHGECPFCGYLRQWEEDNYCGNCGAKMKGEKDG